MDYIFQKVCIGSSKSAPHIIVPVAPSFHQLLKPGHYHIITSFAGRCLSESVMNFLPSVKTENHVLHLPVAEVYNLIIYIHTIGGQSESEIFIVLFLYAAGISYNFLHHVPVEKRLPSEEINFKIVSFTGSCNEKIYGRLPRLCTHEGLFSAEVPLASKAVTACKIAGVGNMKAQRFYLRMSFLKVKGINLKNVLRKKFALSCQLINIPYYQVDVLAGNIFSVLILTGHQLREPVSAFPVTHFYGVISKVVNNMYCSAENVQHYVISVKFILMYHSFLLNKFFTVPAF